MANIMGKTVEIKSGFHKGDWGIVIEVLDSRYGKYYLVAMFGDKNDCPIFDRDEFIIRKTKEEKNMQTPTFHRHHKMMVDLYIREGRNLVTIINYLMTCNYGIIDICKILIKWYDCKPELLMATLRIDYDCFAVDCIEMELGLKK